MKNKKNYTPPFVKVFEIEMEHGFAATSVVVQVDENMMEHSWEDSNSSYDVEW